MKFVFIWLFFMSFGVFSAANDQQVQEALASAKELNFDLAFKILQKIPEKTNFETADDYILRYKESIPKGWFYVKTQFPENKYQIGNKRFFIDDGLLYDDSAMKLLRKSSGQNSFGAKSEINVYENRIIRVSLERNIKRTDGFIISDESLKLTPAFYLLQGYVINEVFSFEIPPADAQKIKEVKLYFKINTLSKGESIDDATVSNPAKTLNIVSNIGISENSFFMISDKPFVFQRANIKTDYDDEAGFLLVPIE